MTYFMAFESTNCGESDKNVKRSIRVLTRLNYVEFETCLTVSPPTGHYSDPRHNVAPTTGVTGSIPGAGGILFNIGRHASMNWRAPLPPTHISHNPSPRATGCLNGESGRVGLQASPGHLPRQQIQTGSLLTKGNSIRCNGRGGWVFWFATRQIQHKT